MRAVHWLFVGGSPAAPIDEMDGLHAQASITGVVSDSSGGVLPGVTVEATSPGLIEKVRSVLTDLGAAQETTFSISGGLGEAVTGGPIMNVASRSGGNVFDGSFFSSFANGGMQTNNLTQALRDAGLRTPNALRRLWDVSGWVGGPVQRDRLWFFFNARHQGNRKDVAGLWRNLNAGDPTKWTYEPDYANTATEDGTWKNAGLRLTWQATPRNRRLVGEPAPVARSGVD